ncbi:MULTISPECIES: hypothetical protein [unclassified Nonomuraea]
MCDQNKCEGHVVECRNCEGKGRDPLYPISKKCDVCKGVGSVLLK